MAATGVVRNAKRVVAILGAHIALFVPTRKPPSKRSRNPDVSLAAPRLS